MLMLSGRSSGALCIGRTAVSPVRPVHAGQRDAAEARVSGDLLSQACCRLHVSFIQLAERLIHLKVEVHLAIPCDCREPDARLSGVEMQLR